MRVCRGAPGDVQTLERSRSEFSGLPCTASRCVPFGWVEFDPETSVQSSEKALRTHCQAKVSACQATIHPFTIAPSVRLSSRRGIGRVRTVLIVTVGAEGATAPESLRPPDRP